MKGDKIKNEYMKHEMSIDIAKRGSLSFSGIAIDPTPNLVNMFNWPADGSVGSSVKLLYHLILNEGIKISMIEKCKDKYIVKLDLAHAEKNDDIITYWIPKSLTLTPRPNK